MTPTGKTLATGLGAATVIGIYFILKTPTPSPPTPPVAVATPVMDAATVDANVRATMVGRIQAAQRPDGMSPTQFEQIRTDALVAMQNFPPGWNFCTMPSYYTRRCEASPMTLRWSGSIGCSSIAICGNHAAQCGGIDGLTYPIIGQAGIGGTDRYQKPDPAAGADAVNSWIDCYITHNTGGPGNRGGCATAQPLPGTLTYTVLTWDQLPPGPQKTAWGRLFGCGTTTPTPVFTPSPAKTQGCTMVTVTPQMVCVTPLLARTPTP